MTPQSIWIETVTGKVKITDFSLASYVSTAERVSRSLLLLKENLLYISPEQTGRMNRVIDYRSYFYSLGIIFYEMLAGFSPCQSEDPMRLIHCHLAKKPTSLYQLNNRIPRTIPDLVDKLICKIAEDRYQSAYGLQFDLETCLNQWKKQGTIETFSLGDRDISKKLRIPQKLYGREREIISLLNVFENLNKSHNKFILISGLAGIGKTALINEVYKLIIQKNGYFVSGKFSHLKTDIPYYHIVQTHQGEIRVQTEVDRYTEFIITLPKTVFPNSGVPTGHPLPLTLRV
ncbi:AAA family ATPase [Candidatus Gracilibacteria bacterium]|nr:AAA family ATPase [Candidatus Gracilibacteria bacterium]